MQNWKLFAILLPIFLFIDLLWLGIVMKGFYSQELGELARRQGTALAPRWGAAVLVYLLIPGGLVLFVRPLLGVNATTWQAIGWGGALWSGSLRRLRPDKSGRARKVDRAHDSGRHRLGLHPVRYDERNYAARRELAQTLGRSGTQVGVTYLWNGTRQITKAT